MPRAPEMTSLVERAREMGEWEVEVQNPDGGVMQGALRTPPGPSIAFNTGMVVFGWLDLYEELGAELFLEAAVRAGRWLERAQQADGTWQGVHEHHGIPHAYDSRVAWALVRLARVTGEEAFRETAVRHLDWVLSVQQPNGWFEWCVFRPGTLPNSHGLAYTTRGPAGERRAPRRRALHRRGAAHGARALRAFTAGSGACRRRTTASGRRGHATSASPASPRTAASGFASIRRPATRPSCSPASRRSSRPPGCSPAEPLARPDGAVPGSFPLYGRYAPLQYPNWAAKFLADSLALRLRVIGNGR